MNSNCNPDHPQNLTACSSTRETPLVEVSYNLLCKNISVPNCMNFLHPHAKFSYLGLWVKTGNNTINIYDKITLLSLNYIYYNQRRWLYS